MAGTETRHSISVRSRFCPSCSARQGDFLVSDPEPVAAYMGPRRQPPAPEPPAAEELRAQAAQPEPEPLPHPQRAAEAPRAERPRRRCRI